MTATIGCENVTERSGASETSPSGENLRTSSACFDGSAFGFICSGAGNLTRSCCRSSARERAEPFVEPVRSLARLDVRQTLEHCVAIARTERVGRRQRLFLALLGALDAFGKAKLQSVR
ncbi:MAG: hypothetical protein IPJ30_14355 [Acidobacteria bacterium]|nr:hypothetical protein [Acidobacteriota bacterium]